jgi:uncharacterized membrane protein YeaQ/YmgE (transglycosylase-associated protein family)
VHETAQTVLQYLETNPLLYLLIALITGIAGTKTVVHEGKTGVILYALVGIFGLFLSQFVIFFYGLQQYLDQLPEFRILFDLIAAYFGAFSVAAIVHFFRPV